MRDYLLDDDRREDEKARRSRAWALVGRATTPAARALEGPVGRELANRQRPVSVDDLATRLNMPEKEVVDELATLEEFGLGSRAGGRWELNERGRFATEWVDNSPARSDAHPKACYGSPARAKQQLGSSRNRVASALCMASALNWTVLCRSINPRLACHAPFVAASGTGRARSGELTMWVCQLDLAPQ